MNVVPEGQEEVCFDKKNKYFTILCWMHVKTSKLHFLFVLYGLL